jgi:hypothetical protein
MMPLFNKPLAEVIQQDIQGLKDNQISESRTLDYKRDLYLPNDEGKREFLKDVTAFANTAGGYLVLGIEEQKGVPVAIDGVEVSDFDKLKQQWENWFSTAVDPPLRGVVFPRLPVRLDSGRDVLIIEIPRSISRPHGVVIGKGQFRFFGRNSAEAYPFEVSDLRQAFLASETLAAQIRGFRRDRLSQIAVGEETPLTLPLGAKLVLHLLPVSSFELGRRYRLSNDLREKPWPIGCGGGSHRFNFDGLVTYIGSQAQGQAQAYTQLFHSGIIEAVDTKLLRIHNGKTQIPSKTFEIELVEAVNRYMAFLIDLGVDLPLWISLSLLGVKGYSMAVGPEVIVYEDHPIEREDLILPEIEVTEREQPVEQILKPTFDSIWNACGYERSLNYDEKGNWLLKDNR